MRKHQQIRTRPATNGNAVAARDLLLASAAGYLIVWSGRRLCERRAGDGRKDRAKSPRSQVEEQAALRRVATMVARGVSPADTFSAVAAEMGRLLGGDYTTINRYEPDGTVTVVGHWSDPGVPQVMPPLDGHWPLEEGTVGAMVLRAGRSARMVVTDEVGTRIGCWLRTQGIRHVVSCPINAGGRIWGVMTVLSRTREPEPVRTEARMVEFMELVGMAIANSQNRADLEASRARVVAASDEARQRIERNLHDGVQQRLISLGLELKMAQSAVPESCGPLAERLTAVAHEVDDVLTELREISRGLHPASLSRYGLDAALRTLARRSAIPVTLDLRVDRRMSEPVEVAIYFIVSEALTNAARHAGASLVRVDLCREQETARLSIHDDGAGGASLGAGSGLIGLSDRVAALKGTIRIESPPGHGTRLLIEIPLEQE